MIATSLKTCTVVTATLGTLAFSETTPFGSTINPFEMDTETGISQSNTTGIITLPTSAAQLTNVQTRLIEQNVKATSYWDTPEGYVSWKINLPEKGKYLFELTWAARDPLHSLLVSLNGQRYFSWQIVKTPVWHKFQSAIITEITLPQGESELKFNVPECTRANGLDIAYIRLLPASLKPKIEELKTKPRVDRTLEELELIWGKSFATNSFDTARNGSKGDKDPGIYKNGQSNYVYRKWEKDGITITAAFLNDKAIDIRFDAFDKTPRTALELREVLMPGIPFEKADFKYNEPATVYSMDPGKNYKFQYWGDSFEIKSLRYIKNLPNRKSS